MMPTKPTALFINWQRHSNRVDDFCQDLGIRKLHVYPESLQQRKFILVRYLVCILQTVVGLVRERPRTVIVTNPPIIPVLITYLYAKLTGARFVLDSHPGSFGAKGNRLGRVFLGVHRVAMRRAEATMIASDRWVLEVEKCGGNALVIHEPPPLIEDRRTTAFETTTLRRQRVTFACVFAPDEPLDVVLEAAALRLDSDFYITGSWRHEHIGRISTAPRNVTFTGFLGTGDFYSLMLDSDVILALSTEEGSVMRAAIEATYFQRPLVVSDWPILRQEFPGAITTGNDGLALAEAIDAAKTIKAYTLENAKNHRLTKWRDQREALLKQLGNITHLTAGAIS